MSEVKNEQLDIENKSNESQKLTEDVNRILNVVGGDKDTAKDFVNNLKDNETNEQVKLALQSSMEAKIGKIRKMTDWKEMSKPENAIILQTYAVMFLGKTPEEIGGIDGIFGKKTVGILEEIQAKNIGESSGEKVVEKTKNNNSKIDKKIVETEDLKDSLINNIPQELEGEIQEGNKISYLGDKIVVKKTTDTREGVEMNSYKIAGKTDYINWAEEFSSSDLYKGIPIINQEIKEENGKKHLSFDFDNSYGNKDYNKRVVEIKDNSTQEEINTLIAGEIEKSIEEKRIFDTIDEKVISDITIPNGLEKIGYNEGEIKMENMKFVSHSDNGELVRYLEFDFDSDGRDKSVDGDSTYLVKMSQIPVGADTKTIIENILNNQKSRIVANLGKINTKKENHKVNKKNMYANLMKDENIDNI